MPIDTLLDFLKLLKIVIKNIDIRNQNSQKKERIGNIMVKILIEKKTKLWYGEERTTVGHFDFDI